MVMIIKNIRKMNVSVATLSIDKNNFNRPVPMNLECEPSALESIYKALTKTVLAQITIGEQGAVINKVLEEINDKDNTWTSDYTVMSREDVALNIVTGLMPKSEFYDKYTKAIGCDKRTAIRHLQMYLSDSTNPIIPLNSRTITLAESEDSGIFEGISLD